MSFDRTPFDLSGETALITGGGTGLGLGMARCFVRAGARVVLVGRRKAPLELACAELGARAHALVGDVCQLRQLPQLAARAAELAGDISVLVNNAGVHLKKPALATSDEEFAQVLNTHLHGAFALTREIGGGMVARGRGSVIFTASMASLIGIPFVVAYAAAKSAYVGVVRTLATEWGGANVRVNAIAPGWIHSDMLAQALDADPGRKARVLGRTPLGRLGSPEDIGWAAVYLASSASGFVTGSVLPVDGGAAQGF